MTTTLTSTMASTTSKTSPLHQTRRKSSWRKLWNFTSSTSKITNKAEFDSMLCFRAMGIGNSGSRRPLFSCGHDGFVLSVLCNVFLGLSFLKLFYCVVFRMDMIVLH